MFEKIKKFLKKYKLLLLIVLVILVMFVTLLWFISSSEDEVVPVTEDPTMDIGRERKYYENFEISMPDAISREIDSYFGDYSVFSVQDINHFDWAENFVNNLAINLEYTEKSHPAILGHSFHTMDQTIHYWENEDDFVTYDVGYDILSFGFSNPVEISGISVEFDNIENARNSLLEIDEKFFSGDFDYIVHGITQEGEDYRIEYSRVLDGVEIYMYLQDTYFLVSSDGRLKEGYFVLAEFEETGTFTPLSGDELKLRMNQPNYTRVVAFDILDTELLGDYSYLPTGDETGETNLDNVRLVYYYTSKFQEVLNPYFVFQGTGIVNTEGERFDADFHVRIK